MFPASLRAGTTTETRGGGWPARSAGNGRATTKFVSAIARKGNSFTRNRLRNGSISGVGAGQSTSAQCRIISKPERYSKLATLFTSSQFC